LLGCLVDLIALEKDTEMMKINLALKPDFNLIDAFSILDRDCHSEVKPTEMRKELHMLGLDLKEDDLQLIFARYAEEDYCMTYSNFSDAFLPTDEYYSRLLIAKRLTYSQ
jgi:Ca2+-binding EF-hand superfamily protein